MFSPKDADRFFLGDLDAYLDSETQPAFYMRAEKPITPTAEYVEFLDGIPQNLVRKDIIRFGLSLGLKFADAQNQHGLGETSQCFPHARKGRAASPDFGRGRSA